VNVSPTDPISLLVATGALVLSAALGYWIRHQEVSVRVALGGSPLAIAGQMFVEVLMLSVVGASMGLVFAAWATGALRAAAVAVAGTLVSAVPAAADFKLERQLSLKRGGRFILTTGSVR
jgi:predicted lysophospholipase L1 biosynthesis ABC-type transport system permease subunit